VGAVAQHPLVDVRADFPVLQREFSGRRVAYLDSAATSQRPRKVVEAMDVFQRHSYAPIHRGVYELARESTDAFEGARERIAAFVNWEPACSIFTLNATEAINLVAYSWGRHNVGEGDEVLITEMEHHSNIVPWQILCAETGARLRYVPVSDSGELALDELDAILAEGRVKLLGVTHVSNVLGTINPIAEITRRARAAGAVTVVDGAQAVPQLPVDLAELDADFYAWTGHKALGPTLGMLHGRRELLEAMPPFLTGGNMIIRVTMDGAEWNEVPQKFEAGTPAIVEAIGLGAAVDYLTDIGMANVREHERYLFEGAWAALGEIPGVRRLGPDDPDIHAGVISFVVDEVHPHDMATILDHHGVAVRAGHHCAQPVMQRYDIPATTRASFYVYNDLDDVSALADAVRAAVTLFG
jgi:cysteine desulfurase / selenocysteine lyase